jgi:hypothetical protein
MDNMLLENVNPKRCYANDQKIEIENEDEND